MSKRILGLDLGSNSIGWAILEGESESELSTIVDAGVRIFQKAVEEKTPTPKNAKRRERRLARRVLERRKRRKLRMLRYLVKLELLPSQLLELAQPEILLNEIGDPHQLRAKALDKQLSPHELGRVLLHLVQRRGFLSNRKTLLGDMADDPDVVDLIAELEGDTTQDADKEEGAFKQDIQLLRQTIQEAGKRTLGEYLASLGAHDCKRNRIREGGHLRTDRQMYKDELKMIWEQQSAYHPSLTGDTHKEIEKIIFFQRPLKLKSDRVGKCSLETKNTRARLARIESQRFRYLQDINNLRWFDDNSGTWLSATDDDREKLVELFESNINVTFPKIRKSLGLDKKTEINLDVATKKLKGNITACEIRCALPSWDDFDDAKQLDLAEDLITINKKSTLKKRLIGHWGFDTETAIQLCLVEFEPGHGNLSTKAIRKLLPFLQAGQIFSDARVSAGYGYEKEKVDITEKLDHPPEIPNPIVSKALYELRRVINALIAEHGKPDVIRIEMARDLEMNTKRYKQFLKQQATNTKANDGATIEFREMARKNPKLHLSKYPTRQDKIRYRLWKDQDCRCAYSGKTIGISTLWTDEIDVDHILPYSQSLDDSYMNKVVCYAAKNKFKGNRTPVDAFGSDEESWNQITQMIHRWSRELQSKKDRFYKKETDLLNRDFIGSQLTDTRYISKEAGKWLEQLGSKITFSKGNMTSWLRNQWELNDLIGETDRKERTDHRHHLIDAVVVGCISNSFYQALVKQAKDLERSKSSLKMDDLYFDPPLKGIRAALQSTLDTVIVSQASQKKIQGAFHEETGAGFIEGVGTVYRANLDESFKETQIKKIIDPAVRDLVERHVRNHNGDCKKAFASGETCLHADGKTAIKRVRIVQASVSKEKLAKDKFGAMRKHDSEPFKWLAYGNYHHVEIYYNNRKKAYESILVTMAEAAEKVKKGNLQAKVPDSDFVMLLHKNDYVSCDADGRSNIYRVQKFIRPNALLLRLHTAATLKHDTEMIRKSIPVLLDEGMKKVEVNAIGSVRR